MPAKKPTLADDLSTPPRHLRVKDTCKLGVQMAARSKADAAALQAALDDPRWAHVALTKVLAKHGIDASMATVRIHRKGECPCFRGAK